MMGAGEILTNFLNYWFAESYQISLGIMSLLSYLAGSIPTAFILARRKNVDIRKQGSGNVGATNTLRVLGKKAGIIVLLIDMTKGFLPVYLAGRWFSGLENMTDLQPIAMSLAGGCAILGHIFPVWLNFKGGKGVATLGGVLAALAPLQLLIATIVFFSMVYATRIVSLGSMVAVGSLPFSFFINHNLLENRPVFIFLVGLTVLVIFMHRENIRRLLAGTESRSALFEK